METVGHQPQPPPCIPSPIALVLSKVPETFAQGARSVLVKKGEWGTQPQSFLVFGSSYFSQSGHKASLGFIRYRRLISQRCGLGL